MTHAPGIRGYFTMCRAFAIRTADGIRVQETEWDDLPGIVVDDWETVDCPKCLEKIPKKVNPK